LESIGELSAIRLLVLDFDGVMTDNRTLVDEDGREAVWVHRGDGWGIARLREIGLPVVVLSTETNPVVTARCRKLRIDSIQGCDDKLTALMQLASECDVDRESVAYVGNDVNDLSCLQWVGFPIAVADAETEVRATAKRITSKAGGWGAVREIADWILAARSHVVV
jgi:YrbI family 3-deoxy-D-manno-octulosonate 8-phosphate phosphatase